MSTLGKHPSASLYVGDLLPQVNEAILYEFFTKAGVTVASIRICRFNDDPRRSSCYAYVNFLDAKDAERALDTLNHEPILGKSCRIMWQLRDPSLRKSGVGNIFVKNLDSSIGPKELSDTFSPYGNILSTKVATDEAGKSKGFGFVHFSSAEAAQRAIQSVSNTKVGNNVVFVGPFVPKKERMKARAETWTNVYIKGLHPSINTEDLKQIFSPYGNITSYVVMSDDTGKSRGFGFVNFSSHESAVAAHGEVQDKEIIGQKVWCGPAKKKKEREAEVVKAYKQIKGTNLFIKNIEDDIDEGKLRQFFTKEHFGDIQSLRIMTDEKGNSKGFGFISLSTHEGAVNAIKEMHGRPLPGCGKPLYVAFHEPRAIRSIKLNHRFTNRYRTQRPVNAFSPPVFYPHPPQPFMYTQNALRNPRTWSNTFSLPYQGAPSVQGRRPPARPNPPPQQRVHQPNRTKVNQNPPPPQTVSTNSDLTMAILTRYPEDQQRLLLGERLYPIIYQSQPEMAGKITGMLLDSGWKIEDLLGLLSDREKLDEKIADAATILQRINPTGQQ